MIETADQLIGFSNTDESDGVTVFVKVKSSVSLDHPQHSDILIIMLLMLLI